MKRLFICMLMALSLPFFANATNVASLFELNETAIEAEFQDLNTLEDYVISNQITDYNDLGDVAATLNLSSDVSLQPNFSFSDMDWGSFAWGFCCWPVGFFVVLLNKDKTSDQKLSFWIGFGTSLALSIISSIPAAF